MSNLASGDWESDKLDRCWRVREWRQCSQLCYSATTVGRWGPYQMHSKSSPSHQTGSPERENICQTSTQGGRKHWARQRCAAALLSKNCWEFLHLVAASRYFLSDNLIIGFIYLMQNSSHELSPTRAMHHLKNWDLRLCGYPLKVSLIRDFLVVRNAMYSRRRIFDISRCSKFKRIWPKN